MTEHASQGCVVCDTGTAGSAFVCKKCREKMEPMTRLKDKQGRVFEVETSQCDPPDERGVIGAAFGGFAYVAGVPTDEPVTHVRDDGDGSLFQRGNLKKIT